MRGVVSADELWSLLVGSSGDHRYLRSFPTRRSSDLDAVHADGGCLLPLPFVAVDASPVEQRGPPGEAPAESAEHHARALPDRKSTRLNSSHTVISYAVFCLKKQNTSTLRLVLYQLPH